MIECAPELRKDSGTLEAILASKAGFMGRSPAPYRACPANDSSRNCRMAPQDRRSAAALYAAPVDGSLPAAGLVNECTAPL